jgi:hypothetical protein
VTKSLVIFLITFSSGLAIAQKPTFDLTIHSRVDTTKQETKEVVALWTQYLSSSPDIVYNNPYWNEAEKMKYADFDFTRAFMYQLPSSQLLNYYKPTILSVEKEAENYAIRTLFSAEGLEGSYKRSNPWCITKIYAVKENGRWKLKNALSILTQSWERKTVGRITFIYPPEHQFNEALARRSITFCDSIARKFQLPDWKPFDFYITKGGDELGKLLGFDFFFAGYATGVAMNDERILFSGFDSEWYPHEFVHMIDGDFKRHGMIEEGFATWTSGQLSWEMTFVEGAKGLSGQIAENDQITFDDIMNKRWGWQNATQYYYTTGAILCKLVYDKGGVAALKKLLDTPPDHGRLVEKVCVLLKIRTADLDKYLRKEILKYNSGGR